MSTSSDSAEQIVRLSLEGVEVVAKISGVAAKNIAVALYRIMQDQKKTKGKARLNSMIRSEKELKIFSIKKEDLKTFYQEAKSYGILYCALVNRKNKIKAFFALTTGASTINFVPASSSSIELTMLSAVCCLISFPQTGH